MPDGIAVFSGLIPETFNIAVGPSHNQFPFPVAVNIKNSRGSVHDLWNTPEKIFSFRPHRLLRTAVVHESPDYPVLLPGDKQRTAIPLC